MRVLVCGGRAFGKETKERIFIKETLDTFDISFIIQGGASGVDTAARVYAINKDLPYTEYPARWRQYGKRAGFIRNQRMLTEGSPDLVVAFPGGAGTAMMVRLAKDAGVPVIEVTYDQDMA